MVKKETKVEKANRVFNEVSDKIKTLIKEKTGKEVVMTDACRGNIPPCSECLHSLECKKLNIGTALSVLALTGNEPTSDEIMAEISETLEPIIASNDGKLLKIIEALETTILEMYDNPNVPNNKKINPKTGSKLWHIGGTGTG